MKPNAVLVQDPFEAHTHIFHSQLGRTPHTGGVRLPAWPTSILSVQDLYILHMDSIVKSINSNTNCIFNSRGRMQVHPVHSQRCVMTLQTKTQSVTHNLS